jgi:hypothetical protein
MADYTGEDIDIEQARWAVEPAARTYSPVGAC